MVPEIDFLMVPHYCLQFHDYIYISVLINPMNINNIKWLVIQQERVRDFSKTIRDFKTFFFLNKSILEGLRRYYLIDSPIPIVVQNGQAPFRHAFH